MPSIAIDYTPAYEQNAGIGRYVRELVAALAREDTETDYRLFIAGATRSTLPISPGNNFAWKSTPITPRWLARIWHRACVPLPMELFTGSISLYHATDFVLPPTRARTTTVLTVHDLSFVRVPDSTSPSLKSYLDEVVPRSVRRADHILADSHATKDDLINLYNIRPKKITVLLSGVGARFRRDNLDLLTIRNKYSLGTRPYIFSVGTIQPRKNYIRLIQAMAQLWNHGYNFDLVIAGGRGWLESPIYEAVLATHMQDHVHFIGFADEADLPSLYSAAECFIFPSLYEGFGLPLLEAMACGTPVITSNVSSLPEVVGDAALLVNPYDVEAITYALQRVLDDTTLRATLVQKGYTRAASFTWKRSAQHLRQIYSDML